MDAVLALVLFFVLLFLYFLPAIIAFNRKHRNAGATLALNFFLGWAIGNSGVVGFLSNAEFLESNTSNVLALTNNKAVD